MGLVFGVIREEMPAHEVVNTGADYQVWKYPSVISAVVSAKRLNAESPPTGKEFTNAAFWALAKYIGVLSEAENTKAAEPEKIAMTVPVVMSAPQSEKIAMTSLVVLSTPEEDQTLSFLLPSKYVTVEDAPTPNNPAVKIVQMPIRYEAVFTISGFTQFEKREVLDEMAQQLGEAMSKDGIEATGSYTICGYNGPFTLPWFRRNEMHFPVEVSDKFSSH